MWKLLGFSYNVSFVQVSTIANIRTEIKMTMCVLSVSERHFMTWSKICIIAPRHDAHRANCTVCSSNIEAEIHWRQQLLQYCTVPHLMLLVFISIQAALVREGFKRTTQELGWWIESLYFQKLSLKGYEETSQAHKKNTRMTQTWGTATNWQYRKGALRLNTNGIVRHR